MKESNPWLQFYGVNNGHTYGRLRLPLVKISLDYWCLWVSTRPPPLNPFWAFVVSMRIFASGFARVVLYFKPFVNTRGNPTPKGELAALAILSPPDPSKLVETVPAHPSP